MTFTSKSRSMLSKIELYVIDKVREIRIQKNISQVELAYLIDVTPGFIGQVESRKHNPKYNLNHINKIAEALTISPKDLLPEKNV